MAVQVNQSVDGKLALHVAAVKGHSDIVRVLLDAGADVNAADSDGDVAIHYAVFGYVPSLHIFKTAVLVYKCRHGTAPSYLSTYCVPTSAHDGRCHLRSAVSGQLSVPRTTTNNGDRSFAVSGPAVWNSLPAALRLDM